MRAFAVWLATRASDGEWQLSIEDIVEVGRTALRSWESGLPASAPAANLASRPSLAATRCHAGARAAVDAVAAPERTKLPHPRPRRRQGRLQARRHRVLLPVNCCQRSRRIHATALYEMPAAPALSTPFSLAIPPREIIAGWPAPTILAKPHFRTDAHRATFRISTSRLTGLVT